MSSRIKQTKVNFNGCLLVASPNWSNELYSRSVCLLFQHTTAGAMGVFLNRSLQDIGPELWQQLTGDKPASQSNRSVHFGGPHSGPVIALHNRKELAEYTTADGVYLAAQLDHLQQLVQAADSSEVRIIIGQAAWQAGELESQLAAGQWIPMAVSPKLVFADDDEMWGRAIRQIGNQFVAAITGATGNPASPLMN